jgi:Cof subfamily protein (haloacid dehalogenase superfamily)
MTLYGAWVFDVDGTLLDSQGVLRPRTVAALDALYVRGATLVLATALPQRYARMKLEAVPYLCERGVFLGGGHILDERSGYTQEVVVHAAVAGEVLAVLEEVSPDLQILVQYGDTHHALRLEVDPRLVASWGYDLDALLPYAGSRARPFSKIVAWHEALDLSGAYATLVVRFADSTRSYLTDGGHALQVTAAGATKTQGLLLLLQHLGVDPSSVIAFGDGAPDAEMLASVGTAVAMGNAVPEVLSEATLLAESNDDDGVARMIEQLFNL